MASQDIIDDFLREFLSAFPDLPADQALSVAETVRARWAGDRVYVGKAVARKKAAALVTALASGTPLKEATKQAGLSRRTGYRVLSKKWIVRE